MSGSNPFKVNIDDFPWAPWKKRLAGPFVPPLLKALQLEYLAEAFEATPKGNNPDEFIDAALATLGVKYHVVNSAIDRIPKEGPVMVVANHPYGGLEGLILAKLIREVRPDVKVLANFLLGRIEQLKELFFLVDPFGGGSAAKRNITPLREAMAWLHDGKIAASFPSGTVSHLHLGKREVTDPEWNSSVAKIIRKTGASVVPIYFQGRNSSLFQAAGLVHPLLRTVLLPRELTNKEGMDVPVHIGKVIPFEKLSSFDTDRDMLSYLRMRTYIMKNRRGHSSPRDIFKPNASTPRKQRVLEEIAGAQKTGILEAEFNSLPKEQTLVVSKEFTVAYAHAQQIPFILREIGRLREITFRQVHEGTGLSIDLDRFDQHYVHLFVWNSKISEIVGAYRIARTDQVLKRFGIEGLYTHSMFNFPRTLVEQIGPALELGRSFVRNEYQKNYWALLLLWKGIGKYVTLHPQYRCLFGTVSINNEYDSVSRQLIAAFLRMNTFKTDLARLVKPRNPLRSEVIRGIDEDNMSVVVKDIDEVSDLIDEIEARGEGVPVLLRQYLKLGGKLLGFSVDRSFGSVLDGLILIDLIETDRRILDRYLGKSEADVFRRYHETLKDHSGSQESA
ncbi:MAG: lysophospholipid acyltransferase family protein [Bdellovibrionales bacterium]|nr:lysophospholipid acyltransferase family protein [Bdellovibrionales bacterium]